MMWINKIMWLYERRDKQFKDLNSSEKILDYLQNNIKDIFKIYLSKRKRWRLLSTWHDLQWFQMFT